MRFRKVPQPTTFQLRLFECLLPNLSRQIKPEEFRLLKHQVSRNNVIVIVSAALKASATFQERIRSLERARVRANAADARLNAAHVNTHTCSSLTDRQLPEAQTLQQT